jgi:hypothetical protein
MTDLSPGALVALREDYPCSTVRVIRAAATPTEGDTT